MKRREKDVTGKRERTYGRLVAIEIGGKNEWFAEFRRCDRQDLWWVISVG